MESKESLEDLKYDLIINCPTCRGTGTAYYYFSRTEYKLPPSAYDRIDRGYIVQAPTPDSHSAVFDINDWKFDSGYVVENDENENSIGKQIHEKEQCAHCNGNGSVYAYFDNSKTCSKCNGKGTEVQKQKAEIGLENRVVKCSQCQGLRYQKEILIKTCGNFSNRNLSYYVKLYKHISVSKDYAVISTVLDSEDKLKFYAKSKPRFKPGEKEKEIQRINELVKENERLERIRKEELEKERKIREAREQKEREIRLKEAAEKDKKNELIANRELLFSGILLVLIIINAIRLESVIYFVGGFLCSVALILFVVFHFEQQTKKARWKFGIFVSSLLLIIYSIPVFKIEGFYFIIYGILFMIFNFALFLVIVPKK